MGKQGASKSNTSPKFWNNKRRIVSKFGTAFLEGFPCSGPNPWISACPA